MKHHSTIFNFRFETIAIAFSLLCIAASTNTAQDADIRQAPVPVKPVELQVGELFPPLSGMAVDGRKFNLASAKNKKATVVALTSTSCPICKKYCATLAAIEKEYSGKGVQFCFLNTLPSDKMDDIRAAIKYHGLQGPYIHDKKDEWNHAFKIRTTAEVFVFDSARTLVYRGAVDDQYGLGYSLNSPRKTYLKNALDSVLNNDPIEVAATTAPGCDIWIPEAQDNSKSSNLSDTYHNRISRIVQNNCVECHREQGLAPFSLESAEDLIAHAGMIKTVVKNKTMPPWFVANQETQSTEGKIVWSNDRSLSAADREALINWLGSKRAMGDPADAPIKRKFESKWNIGKPDKTFQIPNAFAVKAEGTIPYRHAVVKTNFKEDKWISAIEIRPTDRSVVHHVLVFVRNPTRRNEVDGTDGFFAAYVPGNSFQIFPQGFAKKIPAGSNLVFQLHYTPVGKATQDQTEIGLKFFDGTPKHLVRVQGIAQSNLNIKPNDANAIRFKDHKFGTDVELLAFMPHMHLRGKAFKYELLSQSPNKSRTILDIPRYDFNWQLYYRLAKPLTVPQGSTIRVTGVFDNSSENPANPDPQELVGWGDQTEDEMLIGYVEYYVPSESISISSDQQEEQSEPAENRKSRLRKIALEKAFRRYDKNSDGKVTKEELNLPSTFNRFNKNGDDHLTLEEVLSSGN